MVIFTRDGTFKEGEGIKVCFASTRVAIFDHSKKLQTINLHLMIMYTNRVYQISGTFKINITLLSN